MKATAEKSNQPDIFRCGCLFDCARTNNQAQKKRAAPEDLAADLFLIDRIDTVGKHPPAGIASRRFIEIADSDVQAVEMNFVAVIRSTVECADTRMTVDRAKQFEAFRRRRQGAKVVRNAQAAHGLQRDGDLPLLQPVKTPACPQSAGANLLA